MIEAAASDLPLVIARPKLAGSLPKSKRPKWVDSGPPPYFGLGWKAGVHHLWWRDGKRRELGKAVLAVVHHTTSVSYPVATGGMGALDDPDDHALSAPPADPRANIDPRPPYELLGTLPASFRSSVGSGGILLASGEPSSPCCLTSAKGG